MREIKFRAWHKAGKVWMQFLLIQLDGNLQLPYIGSGDETEEYELSQYTGLTDRLGKGIYEGDIVKGGSRLPFLIQAFGWLHGSEWEESCYGYDFNGFTNEEVEIIGNIYETPELLDAR